MEKQDLKTGERPYGMFADYKRNAQQDHAADRQGRRLMAVVRLLQNLR